MPRRPVWGSIAFPRRACPIPKNMLLVECKRIIVAPPRSCHGPRIVAALDKLPKLIDPQVFLLFIRHDAERFTKISTNVLFSGLVSGG